MAVPNNYIDKIKKDGDSRMISPAADMVRVDNDNFDGADLDEVLDEVAQAIGEAGEGGYAPPAGGIPKTDLSQDVQNSLGKADTALQSYTETDPTVPSWAKQPTKPTYTAQEVGALPANTSIPTKTSDLENDSGFVTSTTMTTALAGKQDTLTFDNAPTAGSNNPVKSSGIKTYVDAKATITGITTSQDGTFTITQSDGNSFTVDLNHTHPQYLTEHQSLSGYAKFVLCQDEAAYNALATKDSGTLYLIPES